MLPAESLVFRLPEGPRKWAVIAAKDRVTHRQEATADQHHGFPLITLPVWAAAKGSTHSRGKCFHSSTKEFISQLTLDTIKWTIKKTHHRHNAYVIYRRRINEGTIKKLIPGESPSLSVVPN